MMRSYEVQGQYDYWLVNEYRDDGTRTIYSTISPIPTKKLAIQICSELNNAYGMGRVDMRNEIEKDHKGIQIGNGNTQYNNF